MAETITNLNPPDTSADISTVPTHAGTLDVLANCKNLRVLYCSGSEYSSMKITGTHAIANLKR